MKRLKAIPKPEIGSTVDYWFSEEPVTVVDVKPYTGRYPQWFTWVVRLTNPRSFRGWTETVV